MAWCGSNRILRVCLVRMKRGRIENKREMCMIGREKWEKKIMGPNSFLFGPTKTLSISPNLESWMENKLCFFEQNYP